MARALHACLSNAGSFLGTLLLAASVALSIGAVPMLLLALFWLS